MGQEQQGGGLAEVVSREEWDLMLARSRRLLADAEYYRRKGAHDDAASIWRTLGPLNRTIRDHRLLRVRGIDA